MFCQEPAAEVDPADDIDGHSIAVGPGMRAIIQGTGDVQSGMRFISERCYIVLKWSVEYLE